MSDAPDKPITPEHAWQPLTPRGVAAFAYASFTRVFVVQFLVALLVAAVLAWVIATRFLPVFFDAAEALPEGTKIHGRLLISGNLTAHTLAANSSIEVLLDFRDSGARGGGAAEFTIVLRESNAVVCGFLGCAIVPYPSGYTLALSADEAVPWWNAWRKPITAAFLVSVAVGQMLLWSLVATLLAAPIRMIAFFSDLVVSLAGAWRLVSAVMLPGSFVLCLGLGLYGFGAIDLLRLGLFIVLYLLCAVFFMVTSLVFLSRLAKRKGNPFSTGTGPAGSERKSEENPFSPR